MPRQMMVIPYACYEFIVVRLLLICGVFCLIRVRARAGPVPLRDAVTVDIYDVSPDGLNLRQRGMRKSLIRSPVTRFRIEPF